MYEYDIFGVHASINYHWSITAVTCPTCNMSHVTCGSRDSKDATKQNDSATRRQVTCESEVSEVDMAAMTTLQSPVLLRSTLHSFFRQERHNLSQGPILLISSSPPEPVPVSVRVPGSVPVPLHGEVACTTSSSFETTIDTLIHKLRFHGQQQLGLPLFTTQISSAFCTSQDIETVLKLKQRTGASIIIGAGSGAAIDLAKAAASAAAAAHSGLSSSERLYLIPSTSAAVLASFTSTSLILDTKEETIFMKQCEQQQQQQQQREEDSTIVVVHDEDIPLVVHPHTQAACQAILLDAALHSPNNSDSDSNKSDTSNNHNMTLLETLMLTAENLSSGLGDQPRSIPLCLASSLIPPLFSSCHIFTFWASLVPALLAMKENDVDDRRQQQQQQQRLLYPALASLALEAQSVEHMLQHVRNNQFISSNVVHDVSEEVLAEVLTTSLNR